MQEVSGLRQQWLGALGIRRAGSGAGLEIAAVDGLALFALGCLWWRLRLGAEHAYAAEMLPGLLVTGIGVGLVLPSLASAAAASLPPARFATGSAVFTMSRQLGYVLGVSIFVALLGSDGSFDAGWVFMVIAAALGAVAAFGIGVVRPYAAPAAQPA